MQFTQLIYNKLTGVALLLVGAAILWLTGCQSATVTLTGEPTPTTTPAATATLTPVARPSPQPSLTPTPTSTPDGAPIQLTLWVVEPIYPAENSEGNEEGQAVEPNELRNFLDQTIRMFERTNSNITVEVITKKASGKGGVLDFLRTGKGVAPTVLPDVAVVNATDLATAHAERLIVPLDGRLNRAIVQDLLPAARRVGTIGDRLTGVPLGLEMEHSVYNTTVYTDTPILWSNVLSQSTPYLFPAKGVNGLVNDVTLSQYFAAGGSLVDDQDNPKIDEQALQAVLTFYQQALEREIINGQLLEAGTTADLWPLYLNGEAGLSQVSVRQYLLDRNLLTTSEVAALPLPNEDQTPAGIMHAWVLTLVTEDVGRHDAALRLIEAFLATSTNAAWNELNNSIPVRDSSFQLTAGDDPYWEFLTTQLNLAQPEPRFDGYDRVGRILQQAVEQVLRGEATAEEATSTAVDALSQ